MSNEKEQKDSINFSDVSGTEDANISDIDRLKSGIARIMLDNEENKKENKEIKKQNISIKNRQTKIKEEESKINSKLDDLNEKINNMQMKNIEIMAIFVAFFTFVSVSTSVVLKFPDIHSSLFFLSVFAIILLSFLVLLNLILYTSSSKKFTWAYVVKFIPLILVFLILVCVAYYFKQEAKDTVSEKQNDQNISIQANQTTQPSQCKQDNITSNKAVLESNAKQDENCKGILKENENQQPENLKESESKISDINLNKSTKILSSTTTKQKP